MALAPRIWVFLLSFFNTLGYHFASATAYCYYDMYRGHRCSNSSDTTAWTIAGAVVGSITFLIIIVVVTIICTKKKNRSKMIIQTTPDVNTMSTTRYGQPGYGQGGYGQPPPSYGQPQPGFSQYNQYPAPSGGNIAYPPPPPPKY